MSFSYFRLVRTAITLNSPRYYVSATVSSDQSHDLLGFVQLSITTKSLKLTQQSHSKILVLGLDQNPFLATKLISSYANRHRLADSRAVFDSVTRKNVFLWNTLINGYLKSCDYKEAFELFREMCCCGGDVSPDHYTLASVAKVSGEIGGSAAGKLVHGKIIRSGFVSDVIVSNSLVSSYFKSGDFCGARKMFDEMSQRNVSSWNSLMAGCMDCGVGSEEIWEIVECMRSEGVKLDGFMVSTLLRLCGSTNGGGDIRKWLGFGREIHCYVVRNELELNSVYNAHLGCCLIDMYSKSKRVVEARRVFDRMKTRNVYTWTVIVNGYVHNDNSGEALIVFRDMQVRDGIEPNGVSLLSVLPACNSLGSLIGGKQIHGFAIRNNQLNDNLTLFNALIDMYSKCGSLDLARRVFDDESIRKDAISWSSMICGYGLYGKGKEALSLYGEMVSLGLRPDTITIVGILSACGRSGLVKEGLEIYNSAISQSGIEPTVEICACVVDMLGRSGKLNQALEFIKAMHVKPGPSIWGSLVNSSIMHGYSEMRELAYKFLIEVEPKNPSNFVSLSNLYASSEQWGGVAEVRTAMREKRMRKQPGCSWIDVNRATHCFYVADKAHPCSKLVYEMLDYLKFAMKDHSLDFDFPT